MAEQPVKSSWWHSVPALLTGIGALLTAATGLYVALREDDRVSPPAPPPVAATAPAPPPARSHPATAPTAGSAGLASEPNQGDAAERSTATVSEIAGVWRDNWGTVSRVTQSGNRFQFTGVGSSCRGDPFRSSGAGRIDGRSVTSSFQTDLPSRGNCVGTVSADGSQMDQTCTDSVCGTFVTSAVKR